MKQVKLFMSVMLTCLLLCSADICAMKAKKDVIQEPEQQEDQKVARRTRAAAVLRIVIQERPLAVQIPANAPKEQTDSRQDRYLSYAETNPVCFGSRTPTGFYSPIMSPVPESPFFRQFPGGG